MSHDNWNQMARLTLVCLAVFAFQLAQVGLGKREHKSEHHQHPHYGPGHAGRQLKDTDKEILKLDAFDIDKCGHANFRPWQTEQRAFGCANESSNKSHWRAHSHRPRGSNGHGDKAGKDGQVPFEGERAKDGEFPFLVSINLEAVGLTGPLIRGPDYVRTCTGVLVDKNYVITTASDCVRPNLDKEGFYIEQIHLTFGPHDAHHPGGMMDRRARVWCSSPPSFDQETLGSLSDDLAVIRLNGPVEYVPGKIQPACLLKDEEHSSDATCALAGHCAPEHAKMTNVFKAQWDFDRALLQTIKVKREHGNSDPKPGGKIPYETRYKAQNGAGRCRADQGNPVVCYDKCSKKHPNQVQAHIVGLLSQVGKSKNADHDPMSVISLHKAARARLLELVHAAGRDWPIPKPKDFAVKHDLNNATRCWVASDEPPDI